MSFGRGCSAGCEDNFEGHESRAFSGAGSAGRGEDTFDDFVHAFENSLVAEPTPCGTWTLLLLLHVVGRTIVTIIC